MGKGKKKNKKSNAQLVPLEKCIRVGTNYFFNYNNKLVLTNKSCVETDYGRVSLKMIKKYLTFINEPSHISYRVSIDGYYNLYRPLSHKIKKGTWVNIEKIIQHIFPNKSYDMAMTYLWVMYIQPKHPLPVLGLVGVKNTGKSKFLEFLKIMFEENAKFIDSDDLTGNFNSSYIDKLAILIDEQVLGKNKHLFLQRIKKLTTGGTQTKKAKFQNDVDISFYGKFIIASNDTTDMLAIEEENYRFWVIDVPELNEVDFDILKKVRKEIPAFLYYLKNNYKPLKRESRLWLNIDRIQTKRSKVFQSNSQSEIKKEIIEVLSNWFYENEDKEKIYFTSMQYFRAFKNSKTTVSSITKTLTKEFSKKSVAKRKNNPFYEDMQDKTKKNEIKQNRFYHFSRQEVENLMHLSD